MNANPPIHEYKKITLRKIINHGIYDFKGCFDL